MSKTNISRFIYIFQNAIRDIEALKEFYYRTSITAYEFEINNEYSYGKCIADLFDSVLENETIEEKNNRVDEISEFVIFGTVKLKDMCDISKFGKDTKTLIYAMKKKYKNDKFSPIVASQKYINLKKMKIF